MAKKGKKKGGKKGSDKDAPSAKAWIDQFEAFLTAPIVREVVAAGLIAAADAISKSPKVRKAASQGADKAEDLAGDATRKAGDLGASAASLAAVAARRLFGQTDLDQPKGKPKKAVRGQPRNGGAPADAG